MHRPFQDERVFAFRCIILAFDGNHVAILVINWFNHVNDVIIDSISVIDLSVCAFNVRGLTLLVRRKGVLECLMVKIFIVVAHNNFTIVNEVLYFMPQLNAASSLMTFISVILIVSRLIPPRRSWLGIIWT